MKASGLFHGNYLIANKQIANPALGAPARSFIFPGQGAAVPGMFQDQLSGIAKFRELFAEADRLSNHFDLLPPSLFITKPAALPLKQIHIYRNCALFTSQVALAEFLMSEGLVPDLITAHSFGECAALVAAGLVDFPAMFSVVVYRNILAPPPNELGLMIAVSGEQEALRPLLASPGVFLANKNSHKQFVISVSSAVKEQTMQWLRDQKVAHVVLGQLPQPYHSPLMEDFRKLLKSKISQVRLPVHRPKFEVFSGVSHAWINPTNYLDVDFVDLLSRQATERVDFVEQVTALRGRNVACFYEIGPGRMLETSVRAILRGQTLAYRNSEKILSAFSKPPDVRPESLEKLAKSRWFTKIARAIQDVAGYRSNEIEISHRFQDDLGIDSIKKAEIIFKIINDEKSASSSNFSISHFNTIFQAVEYLENYSDSEDPLRKHYQAKTNLLLPYWRESARQALHRSLSAPVPVPVLRLEPRLDDDLDFFSEIVEFISSPAIGAGRPLVILDLKKQSFEPSSFLGTFHEKLASWRARIEPQTVKFDVALVDKSGSEYFRPLASLFKSIRKEGAGFRAVYFVSDCELTTAEIFTDIEFSANRDLRYSDGKRYVKDYRPLKTSKRFARERPALVVALGGTRGINFEVLKNFPVIAKDRLVLLGRSRESAPAVVANLGILRKRWPDMQYLSVDAASFEDFKKSLNDAIGDAPIDIMINACGYEVSQNFDAKDRGEIRKEFLSKWRPLENVERLKTERLIHKVLHYSSAASEFGNRGQAVYAFSNGLIERQCASSGSFALSWGPWLGVGMTSNPGIQQRMKDWGLSFVSPEDGVNLTYHWLFGQKSADPVIFGFDYKDIALFTSDREAEKTPIVGAILNPFEACFIKDIELKTEPFLNDHTHDGKSLVPACYVVSTFASIAKSQFGRFVSLKNFQMKNPIVLEGGACQIKIQAFYRAPHEAQIYSVVPHASVEFDPDYIWNEQPILAFEATKQIDVGSFSDNWVLDVGESFRLLSRAEVDKHQRISLIVEPNKFPKYLDDRFFDFTMALTELVFEAITIQTNIFAQCVAIPLSFSRMAFNPNLEWAGRLRIRPHSHRREQRNWICQVDVETEDGQLLGRFHEVHTQLHPLKAPTPDIEKLKDLS